jgi:LemA protein
VNGSRLLVLGIAAVLMFWMVGAYNRLVALRNAIGQAWAQVDEPLRRRREVLQALADALRPELPDEAASLEALEGALLQVQAAADAVRARPVVARLTATFKTAEEVLVTALARVVAVLEHHPALRDETPAVAQALQALNEVEPRLAFGRQLFNEAAQAYNEAARQFPTRLLTRMYGFGLAGSL